MGISELAWTAATDIVGIYLFCAVYGFVAGSYVALMPVVLAETFGVMRMASATGLGYSAAAIGNVLGPSITYVPA